MLSVQNYNTTSFCANRKQNTNDYSGTKIGVGMAALSTANAFASKYISKFGAKIYDKYESTKNLDPELKEIFSRNAEICKINAKGLNAFRAVAAAIPFYIGCGALVDYANKKQRESLEPNAKTKNGNEYTKVNMGKKLGAGLGVVSYAALALINKKQVAKALEMSPCKPLSFVVSLGIAALGGRGLGAWADKLSNKKAARAADAQA